MLAHVLAIGDWCDVLARPTVLGQDERGEAGDKGCGHRRAAELSVAALTVCRTYIMSGRHEVDFDTTRLESGRLNVEIVGRHGDDAAVAAGIADAVAEESPSIPGRTNHDGSARECGVDRLEEERAALRGP